MELRGTTVIACVEAGRAAIACDGQVTAGATVIKTTARKVRALHQGSVLAGFAGGAADGLRLFERFEALLERHRGRLERAAVEFAKEWRSDRVLRRLEAQLVAIDRERAFLLSGAGDILEPDDGIVAIGAGAPYALAACRALARHAPGDSIAARLRAAMAITAEICIYTNDVIHVEQL